MANVYFPLKKAFLSLLILRLFVFSDEVELFECERRSSTVPSPPEKNEAALFRKI